MSGEWRVASTNKDGVVMRMKVALLGGMLVTGNAIGAQRTPMPFAFTIKNIMRGPEVYGREPQRVRWSADGRWIYFLWNEPGTDWREPLAPYRVRATAGSKPERVTDAQMDSVAPALESGRLSADRRLRVASAQGDLYVVDLARGTTRRLTETLAEETSPTFSADGREVFFIRENNVYAVGLDGGLVRQITEPVPLPRTAPRPKASGRRSRLNSGNCSRSCATGCGATALRRRSRRRVKRATSRRSTS